METSPFKLEFYTRVNTYLRAAEARDFGKLRKRWEAELEQAREDNPQKARYLEELL